MSQMERYIRNIWGILYIPDGKRVKDFNLLWKNIRIILSILMVNVGFFGIIFSKLNIYGSIDHHQGGWADEWVLRDLMCSLTVRCIKSSTENLQQWQKEWWRQTHFWKCLSRPASLNRVTSLWLRAKKALGGKDFLR